MTRARTLADMISDGVIGTTELADDVITPVKLDETGSYEIAGLTVSTDLLGPVAIESTHNGAYIKFRDSTSSPSNQHAWMGVAGNEFRLFVNDTEYPVAFNSGGALFNPQGGDNDFRVLSDTTNYALFVDGGANSGYGRVKISSSTLSTGTSTLGGDADTYINGLTIENNENSYTNGGLSLVNKYDWGYGSSIEWRNVYDTSGGTLGETNRITSQWRAGSEYSLDFWSMRSGTMTQYLSLGYGAAVFNENGADLNFRVESINNQHAFVIDAGYNSGKGAAIVGSNSAPETGVDYNIAASMLKFSDAQPIMATGAAWNFPSVPSNRQTQANRWRFMGFTIPYHSANGYRADSSYAQFVCNLPNGGSSGRSNLELFEIGFNYGWNGGFYMVELYENYYTNSGYKKYIFHGGYVPSFTLYENYGNNNISLNSLSEGTFQDGTNTVPSTTVDQSYSRQTVRANYGAYTGGTIVLTVPSWQQLTSNGAEVDDGGKIRLLNPQ